MKKKQTITSLQEEIRTLKRKLWTAERLRHEAATQAPKQAENIWDARLLAAGVAHEFNNILGAADGHAEWALESGLESDMKEALEVIRQACMRSLQITKSLQEIPNPQEEQVEIFELAGMEKDLKKLFLPLSRKLKIPYSIELPKTKLYGNESRLYEVLVNLIKNAFEACEEYRAQGNKNALAIKVTGSVKQNKCKLLVENSGPVISKVLADKIFLPFFTTKGRLSSFSVQPNEEAHVAKDSSQGSGLGLFLSRSLIQQMGGSLTLKTASLTTQFEILLPALKNSARPKPNKSTAQKNSK